MDEVDEVKRRIDIQDLIASYLTLKKAGANYRCLCPFHNEKTPSMMVSPEKQIFKCFGCGEGGDVFSFVMKMENLEFPEALKMLAERAGVKLKPRGGYTGNEQMNAPDRKTKLFQVNKFAAAVFHKILVAHPAGKVALDYLFNRGIKKDIIDEFMIGYAPSSRAMTGLLKKRGFTDTEIQNAGSPDRFFRRIIFPITDVMGNVLGFTGRVIDGKSEPKYLNTPETIIFHKGRILYNLNRARGEIKLNKATVLVEGQMDVISSYQAGVKNVVATSGTALTPEHMQTLFRYTPNIIFAFDKDNAGITAAKKAYDMAIDQSFNAKMVDLGSYKDPGEMVEKDPDLWVKSVKNAIPVIDWYFDEAFKRLTVDGERSTSDELTSVQKKEIAKDIIPIIKKIPDTIEQAHYVEMLANRLGVPDDIIFDSLAKVPGEKTEKVSTLKAPEDILPEELLLGFIGKNTIDKKLLEKLVLDDFEKIDNKSIYKSIQNWYNNSEDEILIKYLKKKLASKDFNRLEMFILEVENNYDDNPDILRDLIQRVQEKKKDDIKERYAREIAAAEKTNDRVKLKQLIKEFQNEISKQ